MLAGSAAGWCDRAGAAWSVGGRRSNTCCTPAGAGGAAVPSGGEDFWNTMREEARADPTSDVCERLRSADPGWKLEEAGANSNQSGALIGPSGARMRGWRRYPGRLLACPVGVDACESRSRSSSSSSSSSTAAEQQAHGQARPDQPLCPPIRLLFSNTCTTRPLPTPLRAASLFSSCGLLYRGITHYC